MPLGLNRLELLRYYRLPEVAFGKSVLPGYRFYTVFFDNMLKRLDPESPSGANGPMPWVTALHVKNITIPTYNFRKEVMMYGQVPRAFPVLEFDGLQIQMTLEEDEFGTIAYFMTWLQKTIINSDGTYRAPNDSYFGYLIVEVQDKNGLPVAYYSFKDLYYITSDNITYDYSNGDSIKYNLTLGANRMLTWYPKQFLQPAGAIRGIQQIFKSKDQDR